ncbi:hypothetical protein SAMN05216304_102219 [Bosea sp. OK403]|uniref:hypothetical protein n=1 Tax=Bosea sp. OK403 TaxID=1855286 RepID=UPI0008E17881|nr:hypothetical protein [Bosea sp. OK403]SFI31527.1 hypothetical protein SAMN05216304_102219 [Bosea sp. OK403]
MSKGLLLVAMEPPAAFEEEFNDWYDSEHFPQRRGLPGFESASRWVCLSGWPRWLAIYDLSSVEALATPEYAAVSGGNSTPWSKRLLPRTIGRRRVVAEQLHPGDALAPPVGEVARLCVAQYPGADEGSVEALLQAGAGLDGLSRLRLFRDTAGALWLLAAFSRPVGFERVEAAFAIAGRHGAKLLNLYAPYRRD